MARSVMLLVALLWPFAALASMLLLEKLEQRLLGGWRLTNPSASQVPELPVERRGRWFAPRWFRRHRRPPADATPPPAT